VDIKKELSKYSKDEIIEAIQKTMMPGYTLDNILAHARAIKIDHLQKKSDKAFKEMIDIKGFTDMSTKKALEQLKRKDILFKQYRKYESEIEKLLGIRSNHGS